jgi:hypothetical protein
MCHPGPVSAHFRFSADSFTTFNVGGSLMEGTSTSPSSHAWSFSENFELFGAVYAAARRHCWLMISSRQSQGVVLFCMKGASFAQVAASAELGTGRAVWAADLAILAGKASSPRGSHDRHQ